MIYDTTYQSGYVIVRGVHERRVRRGGDGVGRNAGGAGGRRRAPGPTNVEPSDEVDAKPSAFPRYQI